MLKFVKARDNPSGGAPIIIGEFLHNGADTWSPADWQMMLEETRLNPLLRGTVVAAGIEHLAPIGISGGEVTYQMAARWLGAAWVDPYSPKGAISVTTVPSLDSPYVPPEESAPAPSSSTTTTGPEPQLVSTGSLSGRETKRVTPVYPSTAKTNGISGTVRVFAIVDENGKIWVTNSEGPTVLRKAAEEAAKGWTFPPSMVNSRPVRLAGYLDFEFKL